MTLGEKLKEARKQAGLSQEQLAEQLYISRSAIAKWETDLGIPDIDNLRVIAEHLNISVESLLDHSQTLQEARQPATAAAKPYCGKSCQDCTQQEMLGCKGCRSIDHRSAAGCAIARCCQNKNLIICADCGHQKNCGALHRADVTPVQRLQIHKQEEAKQQRIFRRKQEKQAWVQAHAPRLSRWLWAMFWLVIAVNAADLLSFIPGLELPAILLKSAITLLYAACTFPLSPAHPSYRKAAIFGIISTLLSLCATLAERAFIGDILQILVLLPAGIAFRYHLLHAHAECVVDFDPTLSHRWQVLWKWYAGILLSLLFIPLFLVAFMMIPVLGWILYGILIPALPLLLLAAEIVSLVLLYRTAKIFRENSMQWLLTRAAVAASQY